MTAAERERAKVGFDRVRAILHTDWDPIGAGVPLDEYDSYAWPVLAMLQRKAERGEVETYLRWAADTAMSSPVPHSRLAAVLDKLTALDLA
ncbi:MAG TPA: hypothetical protein PLN33_16090 [Hyphomonadaceae bacterium]|nr:hypothetical protein [Hyphomonadaceae bacterium]HPN05182.1 hypothetical protein [Hyphomonadaceae bacterium]